MVAFLDVTLPCGKLFLQRRLGSLDHVHLVHVHRLPEAVHGPARFGTRHAVFHRCARRHLHPLAPQLDRDQVKQGLIVSTGRKSR